MFNKNIFAAAMTISIVVAGQFAYAKGVSEEEKNRVAHIAQDGMAEVKLGELAEGQAKNEDVKMFARHMVTDHGKANTELKAAAKESGVELPSDCNAEQKATYDELSKLKDDEFDNKYMAEMVKGHAKAVDAIGKESTEGTGPLKKWADKTLPTIKDHKKDADNLNTKVLKK